MTATVRVCDGTVDLSNCMIIAMTPRDGPISFSGVTPSPLRVNLENCVIESRGLKPWQRWAIMKILRLPWIRQ